MPHPARLPPIAAPGHLRRRRLVGASMAALGPRIAIAQAPWPSRPVRLLATLPSGSAMDILFRAIGPDLAAQFGRPFIVEPRPGAGGTAAALTVAQATDDHTLLLTFGGPTTTARALNPALLYDPERDFAPVSLVFRTGFVLASPPDAAFRDIAGMIAHARAHPGQLSYGSVGPGTVTHLAIEEMKARHGIEIEHVSYRGFAPMALDLAAGRIQLGLITYFAALPFVQEGRIRALALTADSRAAAFPGVPTVAEAGEPEAECFGWTGLLGPAGFPASRAERLADTIRNAAVSNTARASLDAAGLEFVGSTPAAFAAFLTREALRWNAVIERLGLRVSD